jgi:eukaryotic-like serine/threonine-protein kinase
MTFAADWLQKSFLDISDFAEIGRGGQKSVYGCKHKTDGEVVLKLFHATADPQRAFREVEAAKKVCCPRVPQILDVGRATSHLGEVVWLREPRIPGSDVRSRLKSSGPLPPKDLMRLALHMLEALAAAEKVRIVHRDVKPANILGATDGNFWLIDFGFARHLDLESLTASGAQHAFGTLGYSPTEQCKNLKDNIDARTDLFALGVTLYECCDGKNPFIHGSRDALAILRKIATTAPPPLTRKVDAANEFRDLVQMMTRTHREQRISTAAEALLWIKEICGREGVR